MKKFINQFLQFSHPKTYKNSIEVILDYFKTMNMCRGEKQEYSKLDTSYPLCMEKNKNIYSYARSIIVRSKNEFDENKKKI